MPNIKHLLESKYLRKDDLEDDLELTIDSVAEEAMPGEDIQVKCVLYFEEQRKGLPLNLTQLQALADAFGYSTDEWRGRKVLLYVDANVTYRGRRVGGIRLRPRGAAPKPPSKVAEERADRAPSEASA